MKRKGLTILAALAAWFCAAVGQQAPAKSSMRIKVDHASVCGPELEPMRQAFASLSLATDYGGPHANGVTHMALLGFDDGSYLELIAPVTAGKVEGSDWGKLMAADAGACAWAIGTSDIQGETARLKNLGIEVKGPNAGSRKRPDGTVLEWQTAMVGHGVAGATLPFMIQDKTPRRLRVQPSASVKGPALTGIEIVVLGVEDLDAAIALFRKAFGWPAPSIEEHKDFGAKMAHFAGTPVILAAPLDNASWLAQRLRKFGDAPVAYLLATADLGAASKRFSLSVPTVWFGRNVGWFSEGKLKGVRLAVIAP